MVPQAPLHDAPRHPRFGRPVLALALAASSLAACQRDQISYARVPKESAAVQPASMAGMGEAEVPPPAAPGAGGTLKWNLPQGWTQSLGGSMRYATLKPSVAGHLEATVVVLPGPAGGELANVNRWRNQIGLPPIDDAALSGLRQTLKSQAGTVSLYDFTSDGEKKTRTIAGFTMVDGNSWFVKLSGDAEPVNAARADFIHLLESLHLD